MQVVSRAQAQALPCAQAQATRHVGSLRPHAVLLQRHHLASEVCLFLKRQ